MVKFGNLTDKFKEGMQDYADGKKSKQNPYPYNSQEWDDWKDGHAFCKAVALANFYLSGEDLTQPKGRDK